MKHNKQLRAALEKFSQDGSNSDADLISIVGDYVGELDVAEILARLCTMLDQMESIPA